MIQNLNNFAAELSAAAGPIFLAEEAGTRRQSSIVFCPYGAAREDGDAC
jgi:hypothetical protein